MENIWTGILPPLRNVKVYLSASPSSNGNILIIYSFNVPTVKCTGGLYL